MTIVRRKQKQSRYSVIANEPLTDSNLSWKATGLLAFLLTKPDDWTISVKALSHSKQDGRDSTISALNELIEAGYVLRPSLRDASGRFTAEYLVFETKEEREEWIQDNLPLDSQTGTGKPERENRNGKTGTGKPEHNKYYIELNTEELNTEIQSTAFCEGLSLQKENKLENKDKYGETATSTQEREENLALNKRFLVGSDSPQASGNSLKKEKVSSDRKATADEMERYFLEAYSAIAPSNFVRHTKLSAIAKKKIKGLVKEFGDRAIEVFVGALYWCREQDSDWWRNKPLTLDNLSSNGKIQDFSSKHDWAMVNDAAYKARVEGDAPSKDLGRQGEEVFDSQGRQVTDPAEASIIKGLSMNLDDWWDGKYD